MKTYREKLLDPRWQRRRLEVLQRADFQCDSCGDGENTLHVHHKRYVKGREPWEYEDHELAALCASCHTVEHDARQMLELALCSIHPMFMDWTGLCALVAGYLTAQAGVLSQEEEDRLRAIAVSWAGSPEAFEIGQEANRLLGAARLAKARKGSDGEA